MCYGKVPGGTKRYLFYFGMSHTYFGTDWYLFFVPRLCFSRWFQLDWWSLFVLTAVPSVRSGSRDSRPSTLQLQLHQASLVRPAACDRLPEPSAFCRSKPPTMVAPATPRLVTWSKEGARHSCNARLLAGVEGAERQGVQQSWANTRPAVGRHSRRGR